MSTCRKKLKKEELKISAHPNYYIHFRNVFYSEEVSSWIVKGIAIRDSVSQILIRKETFFAYQDIRSLPFFAPPGNCIPSRNIQFWTRYWLRCRIIVLKINSMNFSRSWTNFVLRFCWGFWITGFFSFSLCTFFSASWGKQKYKQ